MATQALILLITAIFAVQEFDAPFTVKSVTEVVVYESQGITTVNANGQTYLIADTVPTKRDAVILVFTGNSSQFIEVGKVGDTVDDPTVLDAYERDTYLYVHKGPGEYRARTTESNNRPKYTRFQIKQGTDPPPIDEPVTPPPSGHEKLVQILSQHTPADKQIRETLAAAYASVIPLSQPDNISLDQARIMGSSAARDAMLRSNFVIDGSWNVFFTQVASYTRTLTTKQQYLESLKIISDYLRATTSEITEFIRQQPIVKVDKLTAAQWKKGITEALAVKSSDLYDTLANITDVNKRVFASKPQWLPILVELNLMIQDINPTTDEQYRSIFNDILKGL